MIVAIHQPNFIPWPGYFCKIARSDVFVFLDCVQYTKNSFINRNRIKTQVGPVWLTIPVSTSGKFGQTIEKVLTVSETDWRRKHLNALETNYGRAPHFDEVFGMFERRYNSIEARTSLAEFNIALIRDIASYLGLKPEFVRARDLAVRGESTELLMNICKKLEADCYLAGGGAVKYQDDEQFAAAEIRVEYADTKVEPYGQLWGSFVGGLSVIDALMNCGVSAGELVRNHKYQHAM